MQKLILSVLFGLLTAVPVFALDGVETKISGNDDRFRDNYGTFYENTAVFTRGGAGSDIFMYDTNTGVFEKLISDTQYVEKVSVFANKIVYKRGNGGVELFDINTKEERLISSDGSQPSIYGDRVAYIKGTYPNVFLRNLLDGSEIQLTFNGNVITGYTGTDMYGDYVVWIEKSLEGDRTIQLYKISTGVTRTLPINPADLNEGFLDIYGNYILWVNRLNRQAYLYRLDEDSYSMISDPATDWIWFASINKDKVVWDADGQPWIGVYDLKTGVRSKVNAGGRYPYCPITDGDKILYPGSYDGIWMIDITSPSEEIYSLNSTGNSVTVINPYKSAVVSTIATGTNPSDAGLSPDGTKLYVLNIGSKNVTIAQTYGPTGDFQVVDTKSVNATSNQIITAVAGDNDSNVYVALDFKNKKDAGIVKRISASGASTEITIGINPNSLKISPDGKTLFVSNADSSNVSSIDLATFTVNSNIATGAGAKLIKP